MTIEEGDAQLGTPSFIFYDTMAVSLHEKAFVLAAVVGD
jgi:hypothetical protein